MTKLTITAVLPAHNEQDTLPAAISALRTQTVTPDRILVVSDNSTDATVEVARGLGAEVVETVGNRHRKAGALNQVLPQVTTDVVLVMDADTTIAPTFVEEGLSILAQRPEVGAVGGGARGAEQPGLLNRFQRNEFERYGVKVDVTGRLEVLTGTAACIRVAALQAVAAARGSVLPGRKGDRYDRDAITEDSELTLALRTMGFTLLSPRSMSCTTETMPSWRDLHRQRVRWYKGMLDNLRAYGLTRTTARYFGQQLMLTTGTLMLWLLFALTAVTVALGIFVVIPFWLGVMAIFVIERLVAVWDQGWRSRLLTLLVLPDLVYDVALQVAYLRAFVLFLARRDFSWNHLGQAPAALPTRDLDLAA